MGVENSGWLLIASITVWSGSTRAMATSKVSLVIPLRCASVRSSARQAEKIDGHGRNALRGSEGGKQEEC